MRGWGEGVNLRGRFANFKQLAPVKYLEPRSGKTRLYPRVFFNCFSGKHYCFVIWPLVSLE